MDAVGHAPSLEWWTDGDAAIVTPIAGPWRIVPASPGTGEVYRACTTVAQPARLATVTHAAGPASDPHALWRRITGPARIETLHGTRRIATTDIDATGDLSTCTDADAPAALLTLHADALAAALAARASGIEVALAGFAARGTTLAPVILAWFTARCPEG